jgi:hypothetical protein
MSDIFISYSKADHALALKLSAFLEAEGWSVWWDKSLGAADLYRDEIMKQLVAARAVITIWTANSVKSDWVRAEAGRAKAEGKLIPVKTSDVAYADIPLPFGEMHTENVGSPDLIRAAIVAQLAQPATPVPKFWQVTSAFKYQVLTWIGIVGSAVTLFANLKGVLDLADWARELVAHWHDWTQMFWGWVFYLIGVKVSKHHASIISFLAFTATLVLGVNLSAPTGMKSFHSRDAVQVMKRICILIAGPLLLFVTFFAMVRMAMFVYPSVEYETMMIIGWLWVIGFTIVYLICFVKERLWAVINSLLFLFMIACLLALPLSDIAKDEWVLSALGMGVLVTSWMAVILFSPLKRLTRRLSFVVLGVLTLVALSELSKLNLHQYLQSPIKVSDKSGR